MQDPQEIPTDSRNIQRATASQSEQRQPEGRQAPGTEALHGLNADDNSGSGGTEIKGQNVSNGPDYDQPGNAADGHVGGSSTSAGTGVSGGETGQIPQL